MAYAYLGALLWVSVFLSLGYVFGEKWVVVSRLFQEHLGVALSLIIGGSLFYILIKKLMKSGASEGDKL